MAKSKITAKAPKKLNFGFNKNKKDSKHFADNLDLEIYEGNEKFNLELQSSKNTEWFEYTPLMAQKFGEVYAKAFSIPYTNGMVTYSFAEGQKTRIHNTHIHDVKVFFGQIAAPKNLINGIDVENMQTEVSPDALAGHGMHETTKDIKKTK